MTRRKAPFERLIELPLPGPGPHSHQAQSSDKSDRAQHRRNRKRVLRLVRNLHRPNIDVLLLVGKRYSARRKTDNPKKDEQKSNDRYWLHSEGTFHRGIVNTCPSMHSQHPLDVPALN
jgi:hypothetical protein